MEYIYAVMLLHKAGKEIKENNVAAVLKAAGVESDSAKIKSLIAALDGANIEELIASGATAVAAPVVGESSPIAAPVAEETKEEPQSDANAAAGLGSLF